MQQHTAKLLWPFLLTAGVVVLVFFLQWALSFAPGIDFFERAELFTYDWRTRLALHVRSAVTNRLTVLYVDDGSFADMNLQGGWPWPRDVYGRVIRELKAEGAKVVGIDGFLSNVHNRPPQADLGGLTPDEFLGVQMAKAGNVVLPTTSIDIRARPVELLPVAELFRTNAWAVGQDGLRGLSHANFDRLRSVTAFIEDDKTRKRIWQLAILMAAYDLELDLNRAKVSDDWLIIPGRAGSSLSVPLAKQRQIYIDWRITTGRYDDLEQPFARYYFNALRRERGDPVPDRLQDHLVLIGFTLAGDRADDWGPTPVAELLPQCLAHVNLLNSLLTGQFIVRAGPWTERLLVAVMAAISGLLGWRLRWGWGIVAFSVVVAGYWVVALMLYVNSRYWLPVAAPLGGAFLMGYVCLFTYRVAVQRLERRQVRSVFSKMVSPNIFNLLVQQPASALDSSRRAVTIYFADVRGFTRFMEDTHTRALKRLDTEQQLQSDAAQAVIGQGVRESLETVNSYLGSIADEIKAHDGTLDKYIGDCVMSFWGAPVRDEQHAVKAVRAAIAVQRALHAANLRKMLENEQRQNENIRRLAAGLKELELLPVLRIGSALNSGTVTVGFMGSAVHVSNYTVFGREVNIASRLEGVAAADSILATEATFNEVKKHAPDLALSFVPRPAAVLHGISSPVPVYEIQWREEAAMESPTRPASEIPRSEPGRSPLGI